MYTVRTHHDQVYRRRQFNPSFAVVSHDVPRHFDCYIISIAAVDKEYSELPDFGLSLVKSISRIGRLVVIKNSCLVFLKYYTLMHYSVNLFLVIIFQILQFGNHLVNTSTNIVIYSLLGVTGHGSVLQQETTDQTILVHRQPMLFPFSIVACPEEKEMS